jgi:hypothetical protein
MTVVGVRSCRRAPALGRAGHRTSRHRRANQLTLALEDIDSDIARISEDRPIVTQ